MALPGKKGVGRSKAALILLCSVSFNRKHDCFFEDSPQKVPFFKLRLCTTSQAAHHQHEYVSCNGSHPSSQPLQLQPTVVKFLVNLADKYFCTESRFLMPFDYHKYSQNIWELQENMGKMLSLILIVIMFVVQPKIGIIIFLSSLKLDYFFFFPPQTHRPIAHLIQPSQALPCLSSIRLLQILQLLWRAANQFLLATRKPSLPVLLVTPSVGWHCVSRIK